jgi:broad specificity phosphatase PhoE
MTSMIHLTSQQTVEEPLLAAQRPGESGDDVLWRVTRALRDLFVYDAAAPLVVVDGLDILGAAAFVLDKAAAIRLADHLNRALPLP